MERNDSVRTAAACPLPSGKGQAIGEQSDLLIRMFVLAQTGDAEAIRGAAEEADHFQIRIAPETMDCEYV